MRSIVMIACAGCGQSLPKTLLYRWTTGWLCRKCWEEFVPDYNAYLESRGF